MFKQFDWLDLLTVSLMPEFSKIFIYVFFFFTHYRKVLQLIPQTGLFFYLYLSGAILLMAIDKWYFLFATLDYVIMV